LAPHRCLAPARKGGGGGRRRGQGLFHLHCCSPIAFFGAMTPLEVQAAQTLSVAVIVFAFLWVVLVCVGRGRAGKTLSNGGWRGQQQQQRYGMSSPRTGHGTALIVVGSVATLDGGQLRQQRRQRTTGSPLGSRHMRGVGDSNPMLASLT
jgi:hypothetical protein